MEMDTDGHVLNPCLGNVHTHTHAFAFARGSGNGLRSRDTGGGGNINLFFLASKLEEWCSSKCAVQLYLF